MSLVKIIVLHVLYLFASLFTLHLSMYHVNVTQQK